MHLKGKLYYTRRCVSVKPVVSDRKFLIDFIFTTYLGPDVKSDNPRCSTVQRIMSGLPPYVVTDLGPSYVSICLLEKLYYYLLRYASADLILDLNMLHMYLKGTSDSDDSPQFTTFFPSPLHQQIWYPNSFRIVKGLLLIDDPVTSCIKEEDINRFRSLTALTAFNLNLMECLCHCTNKNGGQCQGQGQDSVSNRNYLDPTPCALPAANAKGPTLMMPLLSVPHIDNCDQDSSLILTGTARRGLFGPSVGVVDIGISDVAYLFRVSLPGVKRDSSQFSCEIESDGRVHIRGLLTGGRTITKQSRVFQIKIRQLCSPGPFTLSFSLPGPVDPRLFAPNFRSDGIFEGVVIKH